MDATRGLACEEAEPAVPDGSAREETEKAGAVFWHDAGSHAVENIGNTAVRNVVVEIQELVARTREAFRGV